MNMNTIIYLIIIISQFILINGKTKVIQITSQEKNHHIIVQKTINNYITNNDGCSYYNSNMVYANYKLTTILYINCVEQRPVTYSSMSGFGNRDFHKKVTFMQ